MATPIATENPYGLIPALQQGGPVAWATFGIMVLMSAITWYIMFTKYFEQQKILKEARGIRGAFWGAPSVKDGAARLDKNGAFRQIVDDGVLAQDQHTKLTDPVDQHEWVLGSLARSQGLINAKLGSGLAFLASVGSTAPFIGLFGTVIGIYRALVNIGMAGQASIDKVAGPVGEALIMTAIGLAVAVPAVLGYNWLQRRNKAIAEQLSAFSTDLHGYMMSNGTVRPVFGAARAAASSAARSATPAAAKA
jgi:biopolymer transport protein ExbB